jgi:hypothetical protein
METSKVNLFKDLYLKMQWEFEVGPMEKVVHHVQIQKNGKFENFWSTVMLDFVNYKL